MKENYSRDKSSLLLVQIGPVQDFITAARTVGDLWSGSYFIAYLTANGIKYVAEQPDCKIIFPCLENQQVYQRLSEHSLKLGQPTLPNRFCAEVPCEKALEIARGVEKAIKDKLQDISQKCFEKFLQLLPDSGKNYKTRWDNQMEKFLQISWQTVPLDKSNWGISYGDLLKNLAARRNTRNFEQITSDDCPTSAYKDALNGKDEIVGDIEEWKKVLCDSKSPFTRDDRPYGAINFIKRVWSDCYLHANGVEKTSAKELTEESNGEAEKYIAAIQMDGDHMGSILGAAHPTADFFTRFSRKLANFTREKAGTIIEKHKGVLVYAGGDDVLALLPACEAVACARDLREAFCANDPNMPGSEKELGNDIKKVTLSAGISFCHYKTPLSLLIQHARSAEHRAKEHYRRDALALSIFKRSGEILLWGAKFDSPAWQLFQKFAEFERKDVLSNRFANALASYLKQYKLEELTVADIELFKNIITADFAHVCENQKRTQKQDNQADLSEFTSLAEKYLSELAQKSQASIKESPKKTQIVMDEFAKLFLAVNFLIRKGDDNE